MIDDLKDIWLSNKLGGDFFGVSKTTFYAWMKHANLPNKRKGYFNLHDMFLYWRGNMLDEGQDGNESLAVWKTRYQKAMTEYRQLINKRESGKLIPVKDVVKGWVFRLNEVKTFLLSLPDNISPDLVGRSRINIRDLLLRECRTALDGFSREGKFCTTCDVDVIEPDEIQEVDDDDIAS